MKKSWDSIWERVFQIQEWGKYPPEELIRFVARNYYKMLNRKQIKILDLGCGTGAASWYLAREGFSVYGIDGSKTAVKIAKERFNKENLKGEFKVGDFIKLDYPDNFFDCVIDIFALQHNKLENLTQIINEISRVLKFGGKIFSMLVSKNCKFSDGVGPFKGKGYAHFFTKEDILNLLSKFKNINIETNDRTDRGNLFSYYFVNAEKIKIIKIANKLVGDGQPCFIIAEAGVNHNGDIKLAKKLIDVAKNAGADAVKFQTWVTEDIMTRDSEKAEYQKRANWDSDSFYDSIKKLELSYKEFKELFDYAKEKNIIFLSTPDDIKSLDFLVELGVPAIKIGSGAITDIRLIKKVAEKNLPIILSTGMSTIDEIKDALDILKNNGNNKVILLHCTSNYPVKLEDVNLRAMESIKSKFDTLVGYSDHTLDIATPIAAVARGAVVIEKHFTLDKNLPGPDHQASLDPEELKIMVDNIRRTEILLGSDKKRPTKSEEEIKKVIRRSLVAKEDILAGTKINEEMLSFKIPGTGLEPNKMDKLIGLKAKRDIKKDELIRIEDME